MKNIVERQLREQSATGSNVDNASESNDAREMPSPPVVQTTNQSQIRNMRNSPARISTQSSNDDESIKNPCVLCLSEERAVACIPCGHLATCVPCGHSLRSCPVCRHEINGFIRIYT